MDNETVSIPLDQFFLALKIVSILSDKRINTEGLSDAIKLLFKLIKYDKCIIINSQFDMTAESFVLEYISDSSGENLMINEYLCKTEAHFILDKINYDELYSNKLSWKKITQDQEIDLGALPTHIAYCGIESAHQSQNSRSRLYDIIIVLEFSENLSSDKRKLLCELIVYVINSMKVLQSSKAAVTTTRLLTTKETQIISWVSEGKTSWEIGKILLISERTVKFHLKNIYNKFNVVNRAQAVSVFSNIMPKI